MSLGNNILRLRREKKITQTELAARVGITGAALCQYEKGLKTPSFLIGKAIADALGCSMEDLLAD